jgi:MFS family permease
MKYIDELTQNWRVLTAASLGLASGYRITLYITNIFTPHLLADFGWSKAQFSLVGVTVLLSVLTLPIAGRLTDTLGKRWVAAIGVIGTPATFVAFAMMTGNFSQYFWINVALIIFVGTTTGALTYGGLIAGPFKRARGLALAIVASAPPLVGAIVAPLLSTFIDAHGWRAGCIAVAVCTAIGGGIALLLMPGPQKKTGQAATTVKRPAAHDYGEILRSPVFHIILAGILLCNLPQTMQASQLTVILSERGVDQVAAAFMISVFAVGVVVGGIGFGIALDRFPPHIVVALALGLPGIGLFILASGVQFPPLLAAAVSVLGLATGAQVNIVSYLVMHYFRAEIFGTVIGVVTALVGLSGALGSVLLSFTLELTKNFTVFLQLTSVAAIVGGGIFLFLGHSSIRGRVT